MQERLRRSDLALIPKGSLRFSEKEAKQLRANLQRWRYGRLHFGESVFPFKTLLNAAQNGNVWGDAEADFHFFFFYL